jgi:pimeloyl-ACP methyl ester carboxylesterase
MLAVPARYVSLVTERDAIAYEERGTGTTLVLLHGHPFNRSMWMSQIEALSTEFRVLTLDLPGYGDSPPRSDPMTMRAFADSVIELLDRVGVQDAIVIGLSMGGLVAMELGLGYASRVNGLVLAATTAAPVADGEVEARSAKAALAMDRGMLPLAAEMITNLFGPSAARDHSMVLRIFAMMLASSPSGAAAALRGRAQRPDYSRLLRSLTVPALVISGTHDAYAPEPVVQQLLDALPDAELVRFSDSGHLPNLEEPDRFNDAVRQFAARVSDRPS